MYKTDQEMFWAGEFGDEYVERNKGNEWVAGYIAFFVEVLKRAPELKSILEFGCNRGMNLQALQHILPNASLHGIEINKKAAEIASKQDNVSITQQSMLDVELSETFDLTFIKCVLIHINPDELENIYDRLYRFSNKYICIAEYYNPTPVKLDYRGNDERLYKRDFAGEMLDRYKDLQLIDYGFTYHRDSKYLHDDINWFLMEKTTN